MQSLKRINYYLFVALTIYNLLDAWHTKMLLKTGLIKEANPLMDCCITNFGINSLFYVKIIESLILLILIYTIHIKIR